MRLIITQNTYDSLVTAAREAAPLEACGLLGGCDSRATEFYRLTNADASGEHYSMRPEDQFAAVKDMRAKGVRMLAIWHSHPATPARMSEEDLRLAYTPDVVYVIVSLADANGPAIHGFTVTNEVPEEADIKIE